MTNLYFFGFWSLASAIDCGENADIQKELCKYIDSKDYNPDLKGFINSFDWLKEPEKVVKVYAIAKEYVNEKYIKQN